jgi:hypothetical protein
MLALEMKQKNKINPETLFNLESVGTIKSIHNRTKKKSISFEGDVNDDDEDSTASSIERGCTSGVNASISSRTWRAAATYFAMSGLMTTASGQSFRALNIGIADFTPWMRAM